MAEYVFGRSTFTNEIWVDNKRVFTGLKEVNVEIEGPGNWDWLIADANGQVVKTLRVTDPGGWTSINLFSLGLSGDYSVGFRNASDQGGTRVIRNGSVEYG